MNSTVYIAPPYVWAFAFVVLVYLGIVGYLAIYLERAHHETWLRLQGPPPLLNNPLVTSILLFIFVLSGRHSDLNDPKLTRLIWVVRTLMILCVALLIGLKIFAPKPI